MARGGKLREEDDGRTKQERSVGRSSSTPTAAAMSPHPFLPSFSSTGSFQIYFASEDKRSKGERGDAVASGTEEKEEGTNSSIVRTSLSPSGEGRKERKGSFNTATFSAPEDLSSFSFHGSKSKLSRVCAVPCTVPV